MSNRTQILDKIERNMKQRGYAADVTRTDANTLIVAGATITYASKQGFPATNNPMLGVDSSVSPYLGIGIAGAGSLKLKGAGGENTIADILTTAARVTAYAEMTGFANDTVIEAGDTVTELVRVGGQSDVLGLGE